MNEEFNNNQTGQNMGGNEYPNNNAKSSLKLTNEHNFENNPIQTNKQEYENDSIQANKQEINYNADNNPVQGNEYVSSSYSTGDFTAYHNMNQTNSNTEAASNVINSTPLASEEKKSKKKKKGFGIFKLTAAALAFGLIAGTAFQGYYMVMKSTGRIEDTNNNTTIKASEVSNNDDTIVPATNTSSDSIVTDVSGVVKNVLPSIVAINSKATTTATDFFGREYSQDSEGSGSGIIIGQNESKLLIVTNNHVINGATSVEVVFANEKTASAEIKGSDANADLAVLSVKMSDLSEETIKAIKVAQLGDSAKVEAGDMAIAIGNALGYGQSVTVGYISAVNREVTIDNNTRTLLQTDAAINPGNSGGALINTQGQVIGINSVKYASEEVEGMGYAIPISSALPMINELMNRQEVAANEQGYIGIDAQTAQNVTEEYAERFNMPVGVYVNDVIKESPAAKAGLEQGDIIIGIDDTKVETIDDLVNILTYKKAGQQVDLKIQAKSNGAYTEKTLKITLAKKN